MLKRPAPKAKDYPILTHAEMAARIIVPEGLTLEDTAAYQQLRAERETARAARREAKA